MAIIASEEEMAVETLLLKCPTFMTMHMIKIWTLETLDMNHELSARSVSW